MNTEILQNGSQIAIEVRNLSENSAALSAVPTTVADLLVRWEESPPRESAMLRTTCARLADYHGAPLHDLTINMVDRERKGFRPFLEGRKYGENSIRTYVNHVRLLINYAKAAGWQPACGSSPDWDKVLLIADEQNCGDLARHLLTFKNHPGEVTTEDVDQWVFQIAERDLAYRSASSKRFRFWCVLRDCGYVTKLPKCLLREKKYGIALKDFPPDLKREISDLLRWKQAYYVWDRSSDARHRPPTAKRLRHIISALYGYAMSREGASPISSLPDLAQPGTVGPYIEWCINEREVKGQTLQRNLRLLDAVLRQYPRYKDHDFSWFKPLLDGIPIDSDAVLKKRRAEKVLEYAIAEKIPEIIHTQRTKASKKGPKCLALLVRNELLMRWLPVLPWRQRNIRECRINGPKPNLYKAPVPEITTIDLPSWAIEERKKNPNAAFWQFHFTEEETKTSCTVDALLPRQLIEPLEEYLNIYRAHLLCGHDPGTLFLNQAGRPMSLNQVTNVVATNTLRHGGRRVTPHSYRDIVAYTWLKAHPQDYLRVSKMLWHANPNEVIRTYGSLFNESSGVVSMEAWLEERDSKSHS